MISCERERKKYAKRQNSSDKGHCDQKLVRDD